jgi:hypothetical protein
VEKTFPKTVKQWFDELAEQVMPKDASEVQRVECRRYFYAGFLASLVHGRECVAALPEEEGVAHLEALLRECVQFGRNCAKGIN